MEKCDRCTVSYKDGTVTVGVCFRREDLRLVCQSLLPKGHVLLKVGRAVAKSTLLMDLEKK